MEEEKYLETFTFPDIPWQKYPVFSVSDKGNTYNLKSIIFPSPKSAKKFTRRKQLVYRSLQAKIFDSIINIGYFDPLLVVPEFPIIIQNHLRLPGLKGGYFLIDYYFPTLRLAVELDSDLHSEIKDEIRDDYLKQLGISVFRIKDLQKPTVQKTKFKDLTKLMRSINPIENPTPFSFTDNVRLKYKI